MYLYNQRRRERKVSVAKQKAVGTCTKKLRRIRYVILPKCVQLYYIGTPK